MNNVLVQCELWCDEILRKVARPPCTCSRHVSTQDVEDLQPTPYLRICPGSSRQFTPGLEIAITQCPSRHDIPESSKCPASKPTDECTDNLTTSYLLHSAVYKRNYIDELPTRIPAPSVRNSEISVASEFGTPIISDADRSSTVKNLLRDLHLQNAQYFDKPEQDESVFESLSDSSGAYRSRSKTRGRRALSMQQSLTTSFSKVFTREDEFPSSFCSSFDVEMPNPYSAKNKNIDSSRKLVCIQFLCVITCNKLILSYVLN